MNSYKKNTATQEQVIRHWEHCLFQPPLPSYLTVHEYANKILSRAERFECWVDDDLAGLVAMYANDKEKKECFITIVGVASNYAGLGIGVGLLSRAIDFAKSSGNKSIRLEVRKGNERAIHLYEKMGFGKTAATKDKIEMTLSLNEGHHEEN